MKKTILILILLVFITGCAEKECKTNKDCLTKTCFTTQCMDNNCIYSSVSDCCGNKICEVGEIYPECVVDCPNCDDKNDCTVDEYDYHEQECVNTIIPNVICCGNRICETGETYENCAGDCPNCDDDNVCTKDSYDYHEQECVNDVIIPCCGNDMCDEGVEEYSNCAKDCPNCDDDNKLTRDSFNYATQKCENIVTHYFIDDFEEGTKNWIFYDEKGQLTTTAWSTIVKDGNTVLRGIDHNWAELQGKEWDNYILKFRFKRIKGSLDIDFRLSEYSGGDGLNRYMIYLHQGERISLDKLLDSDQEYRNVYFTFDENWHTLEIRGYNNILNVYMDDELLIKYKDTKYPILSGRVAFTTDDDSEFLIDDVEIKVISEEDIIYP